MFIKKFAAKALWFANGVLGADKYQKYLAYHRQYDRSGTAPMTEREFWKDYNDNLNKNPHGRCC